MLDRTIKRLTLAALAVAVLAGLGASPSVAQDKLPFLAVSYFNGACPDGWSQLTAAKGRTLLPSPVGGGVGTMGDPHSGLAAGEEPKHKHASATGQVKTSSKEFVLIKGCCNDSLAESKTYSMSGSADEKASGMPYIQYNVCLKTAQPGGSGSIPRGVMTFMNQPQCGDGFEQYNSANGRYVVALPHQGAPAATFGGAPMKAGEVRTHVHDIHGNITFPSHDIAGASGCCAHDYAGADTQPIQSGKTVVKQNSDNPRDSSVDMPYYTAPLCRKI